MKSAFIFFLIFCEFSHWLFVRQGQGHYVWPGGELDTQGGVGHLTGASWTLYQVLGMKQLDVDVSPPAFVWTPYLALTLLTFDLDPMTFDLDPCSL